MKHGARDDAATVRRALTSRNARELGPVLQAVRRSGALDYTRQRAQAFAGLAVDTLAVLPWNIYREALEALAGFAVARMH